MRGVASVDLLGNFEPSEPDNSTFGAGLLASRWRPARAPGGCGDRPRPQVARQATTATADRPLADPNAWTRHRAPRSR